MKLIYPNSPVIKFFFIFHLNSKISEVVVLYVYYNFTKFHWNWMKNKKVYLMTHLTNGLSIKGRLIRPVQIMLQFHGKKLTTFCSVRRMDIHKSLITRKCLLFWRSFNRQSYICFILTGLTHLLWMLLLHILKLDLIWSSNSISMSWSRP